jgi:hypothetical protein
MNAKTSGEDLINGISHVLLRLINNVIVTVRYLVGAITALLQYYYNGIINLRVLLLEGYSSGFLERSPEISFYLE